MSKYNLSHRRPTTFNAGSLIPLDLYEVVPGDHINGRCNILARMTTPIRPVMDDAYLDYATYYIPYRILWEHFEAFMGDQDTANWSTPTQYSIPQMQFTGSFDPTNKVSMYFGIPRFGTSAQQSISVNALPWRAYRAIYNHYYRDTALQQPVLVQTGDTGDSPGVDDVLLPVNRPRDYFAMARPKPQAGPEVGIIPNLPILTGAAHTNASKLTGQSMTWRQSNGTAITTPAKGLLAFGENKVSLQTTSASSSLDVVPDNLIASGDAATVNSLRIAIATQHWEEQLARSGSLYRDIIKGMFGVTIPDERLQEPVQIDADRIYINMAQVVQTSSTDTTSPQGNVSGVSVTRHQGGNYSYTVPEHGLIMTVGCVRTRHSYQQGYDHLFTERSRYDLYWPSFAAIGDQPIYKREIYVVGSDKDNDVWGYVPAWEWLRRIPDRVTGALNSTYSGGTLDSWHYADKYNNIPYLSDEWLRETPNNIDRTLAVQSSLADQIMLDYYVELTADRNVPAHTAPDVLTSYL